MKRLAALIVIVALTDVSMLLGQRQGGAGPTERQSGATPAGRLARPRDAADAVGTGVIRGRVVVAGTGAPVRRAEIQATAAGDRLRYRTMTDGNGYFELRNLPAATWSLRASKTGFVAQQFGQRTPFSPSDSITLAAGSEGNADFFLMPGGVVAGRVYDEFGDPLANARVMAMRLQATATGRRLVSTGNAAVTDDTGAYRVHGLASGDYFLSATPIDGGVNALLWSPEGAVTYPATYFPGTTDVGAAERVSVRAGLEQHGVNFSMSPLRAAQVSGVVIGTGGGPVSAILALHSPSLDEPIGVGGVAGTAANGTFTLRNVAPGNYILEATARNASRDAPPEVASTPLSVTGDNITGLTLTLSRGATITGTISSDDGTRLPLAGMVVSAPSMRASRATRTPRAETNASGAFELTGLIGARSFRLEQTPSGWAVKSITANGADVTDVPLDFRGTEEVTMRVVLTQRVTTLTGSVTSDLPLKGSSVLVFPDDETKWNPVSRYVRTARLTDEGRFTLRGLPPSPRYLAIALEYLESGEQLDTDFLRRMKPHANPFGLSEGQSSTLALELVPRE